MDRFHVHLRDGSILETEARTSATAKAIVEAMLPGCVITKVVPEKKSLYTDDFRLTGDAQALAMLAASALEPLVDGMRDRGYSPREIGHVLQDVVRDLESEALI